MFRGIAFAIGACFIWGLIFVVPQFMNGFSTIEIALGRYLFYGVISTLIFCKLRIQGKCKHSLTIWKKAIGFSLISTMGYYICVVLALRYSTPTICALVLGFSPIAIAFYGNWKQREVTFRSLVIPSVFTLLGLVIINIPHFEKNAYISSYVLGLVFSFLALLAWSWYVVANSKFLKKYPEVSSFDWSTMIGVSTMYWVIAFTIFLSLFFKNQLQITTYFTFSLDLKRFLIGSAILGILCSWVGAFLWNKASLYLPVSLAGQLTVFETIFGVLFSYIIVRQLPSILETLGVLIFLIAIIYGTGQFAKKLFFNKKTVH
jgi:drug/metabolite transporter (DMT)-like permease